MRMFFDGKIKETENCKGIWLNSIEIKLHNGAVLTIDRDTTFYSVDEDNNTFTMEWEGVYVWDGKTGDYDLDKYNWENAILWFVDIEDDADYGYYLSIDNWEIGA